MLKSMTGFGYGEYCDGVYKVNVEIKSVNHRYQDVTLHMPKILNPYEDEIRKMISVSLNRGKIDAFITIDEGGNKHKKIRVDKDLAIAYHNALTEIGVMLKISPPDHVNDIARYPDVLITDEEALNIGAFKSYLMRTVQTAIERLTEMRVNEGKNIFDDLLARINNLSIYADAIKQRAPAIAEEYRARLTAKINSLLTSTEVDNARILQEVILFSEKINYTEELVRLESHIRQFKTSIETSKGVVGRKLDFIVQEMNREMNTIASKANDGEVVGFVVESKSEIEKIREQIQNIE